MYRYTFFPHQCILCWRLLDRVDAPHECRPLVLVAKKVSADEPENQILVPTDQNSRGIIP